MAAIVERVPRLPLVELGEGPHWDHARQALYIVDILGNCVHRLTGDEHSTLSMGESVGFVVPVDGQLDALVLGLKRRVVKVTWDGRSQLPLVVENLCEVPEEPGKQEHRINDGKADPEGRLWAGTMCPVTDMNNCPFNACLFSVGTDRKLVVRDNKVGLSNGLAWSADAGTMYYIDSLKYSVDAFDFNAALGEISNRRVVFSLPDNGIRGFPDGMTMDAEGKLWLAVFDGGCVLRVDPASGALLRTLDIPAPKVTSVAFGGPALDQMFVTTARMGMSKDQLDKFPLAGATFRVSGLGVAGVPANGVRL